MRSLILPLALVCSILASACDDSLLFPTLDPVADTVTLYSAARPELTGLPSALDFVTLARVVAEQPGATGNWDVLVSEQNGGFVLVPAGAFPSLLPAEMAVVDDRTFDELTTAPSDGDRYVNDVRTARSDVVYVVRTRAATCTHYAKFRVLETDPALGTLRLETLTNPNCGDRSFLPPED